MPPPIRSVRRFALASLAALALVATIALPPDRVGAAPLNAGGFTTEARPSAPDVATGGRVSIAVDVTAASAARVLIDVEIYDAAGGKVHQRVWDGRSFATGQRRTFRTEWAVGQGIGTYTVKIGVFATGWSALLHWNDSAGSFRAIAGGTTTTAAPPTTTAPPSTATTTTVAPPTTTSPPTTAATTTTLPGGSGYFPTLPVGAALPSDATCAARVRPAAEIRPANAGYNQTRGQSTPGAPGLYARITGDFVGTTDQIIQWAACKWGLDEDIVRAQTAKESWWFQRAGGDFTSDPSQCAPGHPIGSDGVPGQCAESVGVQQVRFPYHGFAFPHASFSTSYNIDYALAVRRDCFEGNQTWLNTVERGRDYAAGDLWGCVGAWFSGRWYTPITLPYIADVQDYLGRRIWATADFVGAT